MNAANVPRAERARVALRRLADWVNRESPPGLGCWPHAWAIIEGPSNAVFDALDLWVATGTREDLSAVQQAINEACAAWRLAAREWEQARANRNPTTARTGA